MLKIILSNNNSVLFKQSHDIWSCLVYCQLQRSSILLTCCLIDVVIVPHDGFTLGWLYVHISIVAMVG